MAHEVGYGNPELRERILRNRKFMFHSMLVSRSQSQITKRLDVLLRSLQIQCEEHSLFSSESHKKKKKHVETKKDKSSEKEKKKKEEKKKKHEKEKKHRTHKSASGSDNDRSDHKSRKRKAEQSAGSETEEEPPKKKHRTS